MAHLFFRKGLIYVLVVGLYSIFNYDHLMKI